MKKKNILLILLVVTCISGYSKTWTISNSNFTFSPETLSINFGDSVKYVLGSIHDAREVSESTWQSNGNSALTDGFQTAFGGGLVLPAKLAVGTHWYVCSAHASGGMKAVIIVNEATGVKELNSDLKVVVFPNPASEYITVTSKNELQRSEYYVSNVVGSQILKGTISNSSASIDIRELPKGVYFLQLSGQEKQITKFIKN